MDDEPMDIDFPSGIGIMAICIVLVIAESVTRALSWAKKAGGMILTVFDPADHNRG